MPVNVDEAAQRFAEAAAGRWPGGASRWRFTASREGSCWYEQPPHDHRSGWEFFQTTSDLVEAMGAGSGSISVEATIRPGDGYHITLYGQPDEQPGRIVADPGYRFPNHPLPGMPRPVAAEPSDRPTDPTVLAAVAGLFAEFVARYTTIRHATPGFEPGLTEAEIVAAEARIGLRLPEDLRALYRITRADPDVGLLGRWCLLPLDYVVDIYQQGRPGSYGWHDDLFTDEHVVFDTEPFGHVRRLSGSDWWVTFAKDFGTNHAFVDLDPTDRGSYGQVLSYGSDVHGPFDYLGGSVLARLRRVVESLRDVDPWPADADGDTEDHPWPPFEFDADRPIGRHEQRIILDGRTLAAAVAELTDPDRVQSLLVLATRDLTGRGPVDLDGLAGLPRLREVEILRGSAVTGRLPSNVPVEAIAIANGDLDLSGLAGHPALWSLTLGADVGIDTAALAGIDRLVRLSIGDVNADVLPIARLERLRVLIAAPAAWKRLHDHSVFPAGLAAAGIAGTGPAITDVADWTRWAAGHLTPAAVPVEPITITGTLNTPAGVPHP